MTQAGPSNSVLDVPGIRVGHCTRRGAGWLSGTTVVLAPRGGAVGRVDVRGGGPGTRETDLLDPRNLVERVDAVVLSGGSAFGLAAADGVMQRLFAAGVGFSVGGPGQVVPIVPAAVIFDLGRGGAFEARPGAAEGMAAYDAALHEAGGPLAMGSVGAGTGAVAGGLKGGVGSASARLPGGGTVAAFVVVNAFGSTVDPGTGELYAVRFGLPGEFAGVVRPSSEDVAAAAADLVAAERAAAQPDSPPVGRATTVGVIATDLLLTKAECAKVAGLGHDGLARAIRPVHTMADGDTIFTLSTDAQGAPDMAGLHALHVHAADVVTRAVGQAMLAALSEQTPAGEWKSYADTYPSAEVDLWTTRRGNDFRQP